MLEKNQLSSSIETSVALISRAGGSMIRNIYAFLFGVLIFLAAVTPPAVLILEKVGM
jgi:hypothetical protein